MTEKIIKTFRIDNEILAKVKEVEANGNFTFSEIVNSALFHFLKTADIKNSFGGAEKLKNEKKIRIELTQADYDFFSNLAKMHGFSSTSKEIKFQLINLVYSDDRLFNNIEMIELRNAINDLNKLGRNLRELLTCLKQNNSYNFSVNYDKFSVFTKSINDQVKEATKLINKYISNLKIKV